MKNRKNLKPINMPVFLSTTFIQDSPSQWGYSRVDDPTRLALENELAGLENANHGLAFPSGSSAVTCLVMMLKKGDSVLCHHEVYEGTQRILERVMNKFGVGFDVVDFNNAVKLNKAVKPSTRMVLFENITNPELEIIDVAKISKLTKSKDILIVVDNTICTPIFQKPLTVGADVVVHSLTKFISGNHDVLGGALMTNDKVLFDKLKFIQQTLGLVMSPFDCHFVSRGIKTLELRVKRQTKSAREIFNFLTTHNKVVRVNFPGVSGIVSFVIDKNLNTRRFLKRLKLIKIAQSFGGTESTILHPRSMMTLTKPLDHNFFRLSVGVGDPGELIKDLKEALK